MPYITVETLSYALADLKGTADHMFKIWLTLKQMGMTEENPVTIDTSSSHDALVRLFSYGNPSGDFFVPFAHTERFMTMKSDADRSIIQTNIKRWVDGSVVTVKPVGFLDIAIQSDDSLLVKPSRNYPLGLGYGKNGFALENETTISIPIIAFGVWYYRQTEITNVENLSEHFKKTLQQDLHLSPTEQALILDSPVHFWTPSFQDNPLSDQQVYKIVEDSLGSKIKEKTLVHENYQTYSTKVSSMTTTSQSPKWLTQDPISRLNKLIKNGSKAILLYGAPRTGKTRAIDVLYPRNNADRETIQIHSGWGYDELIVGLRPNQNGGWEYQDGLFLRAINTGKKCIVLEEINRTEFSQAIGEVFSLIETAYRGSQYKVRLRNGNELSIPETTLILCTMNTLDKSTEELDDALLGRMDAVEFPPRVEHLHEMLLGLGISEDISQKVRSLFAFIQQYYPLGHGYFADFRLATDFTSFYMSKIRPVLQKHMKDFRDQELAAIDEKVDDLFGD